MLQGLWLSPAFPTVSSGKAEVVPDRLTIVHLESSTVGVHLPLQLGEHIYVLTDTANNCAAVGMEGGCGDLP